MARVVIGGALAFLWPPSKFITTKKPAPVGFFEDPSVDPRPFGIHLIPWMPRIDRVAIDITRATEPAAAFLFTLDDAVMARFADGFPVAGIPEQHLITFVRNAVVGDVSHLDSATFLAALTQRMLVEE